MSESSRKLYYRKNDVDYAVTLYTDASDVGGNYAMVMADGVDLYAGLGAVDDPLASDLRVKKDDTDYAFLSEVLQPLPSGFIGMFAGSCPSGWTRETAFDGQFIRGAASYGGTGGVTDHSHDCNIPTTISSESSTYKSYKWLNNSGQMGQFIKTHTHSYSSVNVGTTTDENLPSYIKVVFCRKD